MQRRVSASFRLKTLALTFLMFASFMLVLYFTSQKILIQSLSKQFLVQTESLTELIRGSLKPSVISENLPAVNAAASSILAMEQVHYVQIFSYDQPLIELQSPDYPRREFNRDRDLLKARDGFFDAIYQFDIEGTEVGRVLVSFSIEKERALLLEARQKLAIAAVSMILIALLVTWILAGRITRRIQMLEQASKRFASGEHDVELPLNGHDEIASTGRAFENMMWQIREKYEAINLSPDGILLVSSNHLITDTNPALRNILGDAAADLRGRDFSEFETLVLSLLDQQIHADVDSLEALMGLAEFRVHTPDLKILRCIQKRVLSPDGESFSEVFYLRDITHESEVDRMKSEFLTTAAHELRTPLASVMGFSELLMMNDYDQQKTRFVAETINRQSQNLKHLVDDLLDIARIEARSEGVINLEKGNVTDLVNECCELIRGSDKQCQLIYQPGDLDTSDICFDPYKLKQALMNILSNAYKYSTEGGIVIVDMITQETGGADAGWFGIRVTDQGIGMSEEQLSRVGEKFYRADNTGSIPGTGLGMALTSEIISLHDGYMEITSQLGQGTQVTLWLPVAGSKAERQTDD